MGQLCLIRLWLRAHYADVGRGEVVAGAQDGVPGLLRERIREAVTRIEPGCVTSLAISPPAAHRPGGQVRVYGNDVDLRIPEEPVDDVLPGWPEPGLDDDAQLDTDVA